MSSVFKLDYNNLRPAEKYLIDPIPDKIGTSKNRKTYYGVKAVQSELDTIEQFKNEYKEQIDSGKIDKRYNIPIGWEEGDYLRYACTNELDVGDMVKQVEKHSMWLEGLKNFRLNAKSIHYIDNGNVYIGARDKKGVPTCVLSFHDFTSVSDQDAKDLTKAITFVLVVIR